MANVASPLCCSARMYCGVHRDHLHLLYSPLKKQNLYCNVLTLVVAYAFSHTALDFKYHKLLESRSTDMHITLKESTPNCVKHVTQKGYFTSSTKYNTVLHYCYRNVTHLPCSSGVPFYFSSLFTCMLHCTAY